MFSLNEGMNEVEYQVDSPSKYGINETDYNISCQQNEELGTQINLNYSLIDALSGEMVCVM